MANDEHVALIKQGVDAWNPWRYKNIVIRPDFSNGNLGAVYLSAVYLSGANFREANLSGANLSGADLSEADLVEANLCGADLSKLPQ
jgi:hypothetical protein